ncbi:hypothetical protein J6590_030585 [Homalodisca vitripennis]|nr:hypothetical protein J6590_030585 [Homalodisca vitripennis]
MKRFQDGAFNQSVEKDVKWKRTWKIDVADDIYMSSATPFYESHQCRNYPQSSGHHHSEPPASRVSAL